MHTKPRGANHLLDTMVSLSAFSRQGWELAIRCWRSRGTWVRLPRPNQKLTDPAGRPYSQSMGEFSQKKKCIILQSCVPGFDLKGVVLAHTRLRGHAHVLSFEDLHDAFCLAWCCSRLPNFFLGSFITVEDSKYTLNTVHILYALFIDVNFICCSLSTWSSRAEVWALFPKASCPKAEASLQEDFVQAYLRFYCKGIKAGSVTGCW